MSLLKGIARLASGSLDLLYPPRCVGCNKEGQFLCSTCLHALPRLVAPYCRICAEPVVRGDLCRGCRESPLAIDGIRSPFLMEGAIREAVHRLKYNNLRAIAPVLGGLLADFLSCKAGTRGLPGSRSASPSTREAARLQPGVSAGRRSGETAGHLCHTPGPLASEQRASTGQEPYGSGEKGQRHGLIPLSCSISGSGVGGAAGGRRLHHRRHPGGMRPCPQGIGGLLRVGRNPGSRGLRSPEQARKYCRGDRGVDSLDAIL